MLVLALDTSTPTGSVALLDDEALLAEASAEVKGRHGELLISTIAGVLEAARRTIREVELVAVGIGPGSFTGVRIGVATAKGLAFANGVPLVGVVSLQAMARGLGANAGDAAADALLVPLAHAHRGEVFGAVYRPSSEGLEEVLAPFHALPLDAARAVTDAAAGAPLLVTGDGYRLFREQFQGALGDATIADESFDLPTGAAIGHEGRRAFLARGPDNPALLEPLYVRPSDAKLPATPLRIPGR
ncbi:MAG: tRNA (adenosine(37)-N6)-threonylcarbamoyltransferase complex dimerization subunit type 1 TsaB [Deltaproteobacteria bacterium]|nr:MAG: tRNA (adenosine(37)-N6)-threonylcarbamoyltransferase complex dimerization subunit type 1 TsaB [Deltaproteobacteria bacterium]